MKPFDLEAAKRGEPMVFGNGQSAFLVGFNTFNSETPVVVTTELGTVLVRDTKGQALGDGDPDWHLYMAPRKVQLWINLYCHYGEFSADVFRTQYEAEKHALAGRLGGRVCLFEYEDDGKPGDAPDLLKLPVVEQGKK